VKSNGDGGGGGGGDEYENSKVFPGYVIACPPKVLPVLS
jgi:hypothetical protein